MPRKIEVIVNGTRYSSIAQACKAYDVSTRMVHSRIKYGWSIEESITAPKKRAPRIINLEGQIYMSLKDVAKEFGITYETLHSRIKRGMSLLDAVTTPVEEVKKIYRGNCRITSVDGVYYDSIKEAAEAHGVDPYLVRGRLHNGWGKDRAFKTPNRGRRSR